jgi:hypothetical protein
LEEVEKENAEKARLEKIERVKAEEALRAKMEFEK